VNFKSCIIATMIFLSEVEISQKRLKTLLEHNVFRHI